MSDKLDLSKLKKDIDSLKQEQSSRNQTLGIETTKNIKKPFLKGLVEAWQHNTQNESTEHLKRVAMKSDEFSGDPIMKHTSSSPQPKKTTPQKQQHSSGGLFEEADRFQNNGGIPNTNNDLNGFGTERDDDLYREIERRTQEYNKRAGKDLNLAPEEYIKHQYTQQNSGQQNVGNIPSNFEEQVIGIFEKYFGNRINEIIKEVITEVFLTEKMNQGIVNNKETVQEIVKETIRSIKRKK